MVLDKLLIDQNRISKIELSCIHGIEDREPHSVVVGLVENNKMPEVWVFYPRDIKKRNILCTHIINNTDILPVRCLDNIKDRIILHLFFSSSIMSHNLLMLFRWIMDYITVFTTSLTMKGVYKSVVKSRGRMRILTQDNLNGLLFQFGGERAWNILYGMETEKQYDYKYAPIIDMTALDVKALHDVLVTAPSISIKDALVFSKL